MKIRHPALVRGLGFAGSLVLKGLLSTLRLRIDSRAAGEGLPIDPRRQPCLYGFWHENILIACKFGAKSKVLTSKHADGELVTQLIDSMGMKAIRGSSRRGGTSALLELLRYERRTHIAITPDGPRGPRRHLQPGIVYLASRTGRPIAVVGVGYEKAWRARSWDQFAVPYPGSLVTCVAAELIHVPAHVDSAGLEEHRRRVERRLEEVEEDARRWAAGLPRLAHPLPVSAALAKSA